MLTRSVSVYYQLYNYYQNHRRYVISWSPRQLRADDITDVKAERLRERERERVAWEIIDSILLYM